MVIVKILSLDEFAKIIDHTNLRPNATSSEIARTVKEAKIYNFRGVCVPLIHVPLARKILQESDIKIVTVVGFPFGNNPTEIKVRESQIAADWGADEIDMVMNISFFKSGLKDKVLDDIKSVIESSGLPVKVIIETSYLTEDEIAEASRLVAKSGAFCIKTNTGFGARGVSLDDVRIIRDSVKEGIMIKASGGIKDINFALALIERGANIIGASAGVELYQSYKKILEKRL
ncbi:MAG: deoxyribose-phosphate aldolase [Candidatus Korarchaeota archaeon]